MTDHLSDCSRFDEPIALLAAGCLPTGERDAVRRHLERCPACAARHDELVSLCGVLRDGRPDASAPAAVIHDRTAGARNSIHPRPMSRRMPSRLMVRLGVGVAAASVLVVVGMILFSSRPSSESVDDLRMAVDAAGAASAPAKAPAFDREQPPTLYEYESAFAKSDAAFDALLCRDRQWLPVEPPYPRSLLKELQR